VVYIAGDVGRPGGFVLDNGELTVLQALALAGGAAKTAKLNQSRLIRKTATGRQEIHLELAKILSSKAPDVPLQNDDILFVPSSAAKGALRRGTEAAIMLTTGLVLYRR
jgi:polysaccharide export outer membrane protein